MTEHSKLMGGSNIARRLQCPGSYQQEQASPQEREGGEAARAGSLIHAVLEDLLNNPQKVQKDPTLAKLVGYAAEIEGATATVDKAMLSQKIHPMFLGAKEVLTAHPGMEFYTERRVCPELAGYDGVFGTTDLLGVTPDGPLLVADFKSGKRLVAAQDNPQLLLYCGAALYDQSQLKDPFTGKDSTLSRVLWRGRENVPVELAIIQPGAKAGGSVDLWKTDTDAVREFLGNVRERLDEIRSDSPPFHTGPACYWCHGQRTCQTFRQSGKRENFYLMKQLYETPD